MHPRPFLHLFLVSSATAATLRDAGISTAGPPSNLRTLVVSPRSSPKPNAAPLVSDVHCRKEEDVPGHPAIGTMAQYRAVQRFCADEVTDASLSASDDPAVRNGRYARDARFRYRDEAGVNHDFGISWEAGCKINLPSQSLRFPFGKERRWKEPLSCQKLLRLVFSSCDNGGVGGTVRAGCLVYNYTGGTSVMDPLPI